MTVGPRQALDEGAIRHAAFIEHYWRVARLPSRWAARWVAFKMSKIGVPSAARVLDLGCGPGWLARYLAERFPAMRFVAADISEPMIRRAARGPTPSVNPSNLHYLVGDGYRLPFAAGQFDLVLSAATLHHLPDLVGFFDEVDRVLTVGGRVLISDMRRDVSRLLWPVVRLADWLERWRRPAAARDFFDGIAKSFRAAYDEGEIRRGLEKSALGGRACYHGRPLGHWVQSPVGGGRGQTDI